MSQQLIYGIRPIIEAIEAGKPLDKVYIDESARGELQGQLRKLLKEVEIPHQILPQFRFFKVADRNKNHQGVVALVSLVEFNDIEEIVQRAFENGEMPLIMVLDKITDVRNFGAIARSAECMGVHALLLPSRGGAAINEDAIKTSAGALLTLPVCRSNNLKDSIDFLKNSGLTIASCTEEGAVDCYTTDLNMPLAIILGNEETGVSSEYISRSDVAIKIPMTGEIESLNVSVAAGIVLYEVARQRAVGS